jgi:hypothetical protein
LKTKFLICISLLLSGCSSVLMGDKTPMEKVYYKSQSVQTNQEENIKKIEKTPVNQYQHPFYPVINPPEVKRVWICPHTTENGNLIGGYWIYIITKEPSWYIESPEGKKENIKVIIPYKPETQPQTQQQGKQSGQSE